LTTQSEVQVLLTLRDRASSGLKRFSGGLESLSTGLRRASMAMTALAGGAALLGKGFITAALEQERALKTLGTFIDRTGVAFADVREEVLRTTAALQAKTNFGDEEQIRVLQQLVALSGSYENSLAALPAVLDLSEGLSISLSSATNLLGRGLSGNTELFSRYGLEIEKGTTATELITKITNQFGGAAAANVDPLKQMSNTIGDLKEAIGRGLLPVVVPLVETIKDAAEAMSEWSDAHPDVLKNIAKVVLLIGAAGVGAGLISVLLKLVGVIKTVVTSVAGLAIAMGGLSLPMLALVAVFVGVLVAAVLLRDKLGPIFESIGAAFAQFINTFIDDYNQLIRLANTFRIENHEMLKRVEFNWRSTGEAVGDTIQDYMDVVTGAISAFKNFGSVTQEVGAETLGWMGRMGEGFRDLADDTDQSSDAIDGLGQRLFEVNQVTGEFLIPQIQSRNLTKEMNTAEALRNNILAIMAERTRDVRKEQELLNEVMLETQAPGVPLGLGGAPPTPPGIGSLEDVVAVARGRRGTPPLTGRGRYIIVEGRIWDRNKGMFLDEVLDEALGDAVLDAG